jgi:hypothetical protein
MSRLSHSFSVEYAELYGVECAILINHFQFWIEQNQRTGKNFHDGKTWMYQTQKEIAAIYPYWSEDVVFKLMKKLEDLGVIEKGNFNRSAMDRTAWYAFKNEKMFTKPSNDGMETAKRRNANRQTTAPIPDTKQDTKENDDDDARETADLKGLVEQEKTIPETIVYRTPSGKEQSVSKNEIFRRFTKKPFKTQTLIDAIKRLLERQDLIGDVFRYLETICAQIEGNDRPIAKPERKPKRSAADSIPMPKEGQEFAPGCGEGGWYRIQEQMKKNKNTQNQNEGNQNEI